MISYNKPFIVGKELFNIAQAVIENKKLSGDGKFTQRCQAWLEEQLSCRKALLTHSCTAALEMSALLIDIQPGDEVIMPSYTFVSTANAFVLRGGIPVFVDIRSDTLNVDEKLIEAAITDKTKAIVCVHYAGVACEMDTIMDIASCFNLFVIEDAAQALLSEYKGVKLGSIAHLAALSFHETKNIISGEGGALLVNDQRFVERAEVIWEKGTNRKKFYRGEVDKYSWVDVGSSYLPSEMIAAFLYSQFEHAEKIIAKRKKIFCQYYEGLKGLADRGFIRIPDANRSLNGNGHIFYVITDSEKEQKDLINYMKSQQIIALFHYIPLHSSDAGKKYGRFLNELSVTDQISQQVVRLPLYFDMSSEDVANVISTIEKFYNGSHLYSNL